jgi:class 3 adenylate cyclase/tetratricopeptide (TPR) repeat protein
MNCPHCHFDSPPGMKFCGQCGAKLSPLCPQCGTENPPGFKFCGECGSSLLPPEPDRDSHLPAPPVQTYTPPYLAAQVLQSRSALEGERKQVTVLFCDLVGSTSLAERLGSETMHLLLNRFFELALSEVHRYEGTINQFLGDGFMALFGAPIAHEDHARRAALAALGFQRSLLEHHPELGKGYGVELRARMGINTGWVVVGGIGDQLRRDYTAVGDTTNLAARLQQIAAPGTVLVSEATGRLLQGSVQLEALGAFEVKGKAEPVPVFKILGVGPPPAERATLNGAALSPFVGRQREMEVLRELLARAAGGEGQVVGVSGEAGTGKSRLLRELRAQTKSTVYLCGRCLSYGSGMPYLPLIHMLRDAWGIGESDSPAVVTGKVRSNLERLGLSPETSLPYALRLLGVQQEENGRISELSPKAVQMRTFRLLRQVILNSGHGGLVVLQIEDLHWIDPTSEELLSYLVERLPATRMMLLFTYRSGYRPPWIERSYATQITLPRLTDRESRQVMAAVQREARMEEDLVQTVLAKAEGNPFFVEELTRSLLEHPEVAVPDTIQGVLLARIDRLPEEHKRLLQTASVLGREFSLSLLSAVWESPDTAGDLLSDLQRWEFLYEEHTAEEPAYFFKHALTQETVYQTLLTNRRQALHSAAGRAFETLHGERLEDVYDSLAWHYSKAGIPEKAVLYLELAAGRAALGYAHTEAAKALRQALVHAEHLGPERDRRLVELSLQLANSLLPLARFQETLEILSRQREILDRLRDPSLAGPYFFWQAHTHSYLGSQEEAARNADRAITEAHRYGDTWTEGKARYVLSRDAFWSGRFSDGIEQGLQAIQLLEQTEDRWWQGQAYWVAGFHHYVLGQFEEAFAAMAQVHAIWEALQDPRLDPSWSTGYFHASLGEWQQGIETCRGGLERARDPLNTGAAMGFLGYAYLQQGDLSGAIETLEDAVRRMEQAGMRQLEGWFSAFLAEAYALAGRLDEARGPAHRALEITGETRFRYGVGLAQRTLGCIALAGRSLEEAEGWLCQALETFLALEVPFEAGRTRLDLALLSHARGDSDEAASQLGIAHRLFGELRVPRYVERAERLARELAGPLAV